MAHVVVGISGASGIILAKRAVTWLTELGHFVDLVMSRSASQTASLELGKEFASAEGLLASLPDVHRDRVTLYRNSDFSPPIASGSARRHGMLIIPCSMGTVAAIAHGLADNLIRRAADVTLKERRPLVLVPRESPFSALHLKNLLSLAQMGVVIAPPVPAWYLQPGSMGEMEEIIAARAIEALGLEPPPVPRWEGSRHTIVEETIRF
ncbi:MAG: UbiX family flavin prenyltransferase [Verrucomicrobia bacterium]|nr:UbiX family flavin prenyltransferase [Verrucomicrobiota bacterium]